MKLSNYHRGIGLAFLVSLISGFSIFFSSFAVKVLKDPFVFTTLKNIIVALILCSFFILYKKWSGLKLIKTGEWIYLILIGIIGGGAPFLLFFKGLSMTSPIAGGFIHKTLFIWVSVLAIIFLKEKLGKIQWVALGVLVLGNFLLGTFNSFRLGAGETMILLATVLWAVEYILAKKVLSNLDSLTVAWARMFFGSFVLISYLLINGKASQLLLLDKNQWGWTALITMFLLGYVTLWYKALKLAPASTVSSVLVLGSLITTSLSLIFINGFKINSLQIGGMILIIAGLFMFLAFRRKGQEIQRLALSS
ncbi:hypothetical protein COY62_00310 [bacterium (Candidatus Howlettbacteria) CG_4_10_14_0_8_um_filter_40_9]|nr:MAG: hypothetical protein COY62_00310 [bacterium (Candidatus Howlettbacteria) CG_4_10_14_0_8_um_filter_40_9]